MTIATLDRESAREIDHRARDEYGLSTLVLMENAGRGVADLLERFGIAGTVVIACGKGQNGGDGFVLARHLDLRKIAVKLLVCCRPEELEGDSATNYRVAAAAGIEMCWWDEDAADLPALLQRADWIVDALLGTGLRGNPRPPIAAAIEMLNAASGRKLAIDVPSGLDCDTGIAGQPTFRADHTATFVASKRGFDREHASRHVGQVHVLDIGAPRRLIEEVLGRGEDRRD